jgi:hypothetical protein
MGYRNIGDEPCECCTESAGRIALYHEKIRRNVDTSLQRIADGPDMRVGVRLAWAAKPDLRVARQPEIIRGKPVLVSEDQRRDDAMRKHCAGDGPHLDGFRSGADDQPDVGEKQ